MKFSEALRETMSDSRFLARETGFWGRWTAVALLATGCGVDAARSWFVSCGAITVAFGLAWLFAQCQKGCAS